MRGGVFLFTGRPQRKHEAINRLLKPAAPPDSGNGVVVPHEAPAGPPKPKKKGKK